MATTPRYSVVKVDATDTVATAMLTKLNAMADAFDNAAKLNELVAANIPDLVPTVQQIVANSPAVWG